MPIYEYLCPKCNIKQEIICPISYIDKEWKCTICGSLLKRIFTAPAVHWTGGSPTGGGEGGV